MTSGLTLRHHILLRVQEGAITAAEVNINLSTVLTSFVSHPQVSCTPCEGKALPFHVTVSVAEPFSSNVTNLPREKVEEVLKKNDYSVPILEVYPVQGLGSEVDNIAEALEHVR